MNSSASAALRTALSRGTLSLYTMAGLSRFLNQYIVPFPGSVVPEIILFQAKFFFDRTDLTDYLSISLTKICWYFKYTVYMRYEMGRPLKISSIFHSDS